jgi:nicotinamidase-related amidase
MKHLFVIDVQKGFINKHTEFLVPRIDVLLKKNLYGHVVATKFKNVEFSPFVDILGWSGMMDAASQEFAFDASNVRQIDKYGYSGLTWQLKQYISSRDAGEIDLAGIDTDGCVLATAIDLFEIGVKVRILEHYCASTGGKELHEAGLAILGRMIGRKNIIRGEMV